MSNEPKTNYLFVVFYFHSFSISPFPYLNFLLSFLMYAFCFFLNLIYRYLTECYDELGTQYKVPIYCLSYPINIVKEDNGRDSPAEYSEPVDGGQEVILKLRLSSSFADTKLIVYSKDTIGQCKKKLQVCGSHANRVVMTFRLCFLCVSIYFHRLTFSGYMHFSD